METCRETHEEEEVEEEVDQVNQEKQGEGLEKGSTGCGVRVKIVLTREELDWMMFQLKDKGGKSLEDVLKQIEKGRSSAAATAVKFECWKPSLESIMESPEVPEMDR